MILFDADPAAPDYLQRWATNVDNLPPDSIATKVVKGRAAARMTAKDSYTDIPGMNRTNPAVGLLTPYEFKNGDMAYIKWSILFPDQFPKVKSWVSLGEIYGPPFMGAPVLGLSVRSDDRLGWCRDLTHGFDEPWSVPVERGTWHDVIFQVLFSPDPAKGEVMIWHNGAIQGLWHGATLIPGVSWNPPRGRNAVWAMCYYRKGDYPEVTVYHGRTVVATTFREARDNT